jgi:putative DNA primase/helicase
VIAAEIAAALGNVQSAGSEIRCTCPVCNGHNLTLRDGARHLLVKCFNGCDGRVVFAELRRRGLVGKPTKGNGAAPEEPETRAEHEAKAKSAKAKRQARTDNALDIFRNSFPAANTMVEVYFASRLILSVPPSLRFAPKIWSKDAGANYPAAVALIEHGTWGAIGIHCILMNPLDASVRLTLKDRKQSRGVVKGGAVRLAPAGPVLAVAEGIEDALTYWQATGIPAWAAISDTGIRNFVPPPLAVTSTLHLLEDQDANQAGQKGVADAARRLAKKGYEIEIVRPLIGKDVNDALLKLGPSETLFTIEDYEPAGASGDWYSKCLAGSDGRTLNNLTNALLGLGEDRFWKDAFACDAMFGTALLKRGRGVNL